MDKTIFRRRGAVILETENGILVVAGKRKKFALPGGGAKKGESRRKAAIRELYEETGLKTKKIKYLFRYLGHKWHNHKGAPVKNDTKIFLVRTIGVPRPRNEIRYIKYWTQSSKVPVSKGTERMIKKYLKKKNMYKAL